MRLGRAVLLAGLAFATSAPAAPGRAPVRLQAFGDPAETAAYRDLIAAYERKHPGRSVELIAVGKQRDHMAKLAAAFAAGDPPELFLLNFRRFGQLAERGVLEPLGPALAARSQFRAEEYYEPALEAFRVGGESVCVPQNVSSLVVYWNRRLFREHDVPAPTPDWTFADFHRAARALVLDQDGDGSVDVYGLGLEPTLIRLAPFVWALGGDLVDDLARPRRLVLGLDPAPAALQFVKRLALHQLVPPLPATMAEDHESRFARGALGMILQSRRYTATLRAVPGLEWDVAAFPRYEQPVGVLHSDAYCLARDAADEPAALDFVAFALGDEGMALLARSGRTVPSRRAVAESSAFLDPTQPPASARVFLDAIPHLRRTPNVGVWNEIEARADPLIEDWFYEAEAARRPSDPPPLPPGRSLAAQLTDALQPLLDEANRAP